MGFLLGFLRVKIVFFVWREDGDIIVILVIDWLDVIVIGVSVGIVEDWLKIGGEVEVVEGEVVIFLELVVLVILVIGLGLVGKMVCGVLEIVKLIEFI